MIEPSHDAANLLRPTTIYRKMVLAVLLGTAILVALGYAATSRNLPWSPKEEGYELLALTSGVVKQVVVQPGQMVQKGDVLLLLDDTNEQQELADSRTELERVAAASQSAGIAVALPPPMAGLGGRIVTMGPLKGIKGEVPALPKAEDSGKVGTLPPVTGAGDAPEATEAPRPRTELDARVREMEEQVSTIQTSIVEMKQKADDAGAQLLEAERNAEAARVIADQRKKQAEKMRMLLGEGVVSQVETSRSEALAASAQGGYESALNQASEVKGARDAASAEVTKLEANASKLEKDIVVAKATLSKLAALPEAPPIASASTTRVPIPQMSKPAYVKAEPAPPVPTKVLVDKGAKIEADGQLTAAKLRFDRAEAALEGRKIVASRAGTILKVLVRRGDQLTAGTSIVTIRFEDKPSEIKKPK